MRKDLTFKIVLTIIFIGCVIMSVKNLSERKNLLKQFQNLEMEKNLEIDFIREKARKIILQQMSATNEMIDPAWIIYERAR